MRASQREDRTRRSASRIPAQLVAALIPLAGCGAGAELAPPADATTSPPPASESASAVPTTGTLFADPFDGERLDDTKWHSPDRPDLVHQGQGGLNLAVTAADTERGVEAGLTPKYSGPFRELTFTMTVPSFGESGPGGPAVVISQASGRNHELAFGPSNGQLQAVALVCPRPSCAGYDEFMEPATNVSFARGEIVPARIVQTDGIIQFFVRDELVGESAADDTTPMSGFRIELYGADGESWHVVLDSLRVDP